MSITVPCLICSSERTRFIDIPKKFLFCRRCGTVFNLDHECPDYSDTYFTTDYKNQYGRTYSDDYEQIYSFSIRRIARMKKLVRKQFSGCTLLEIGCALGFFMKAARDSGFMECTGIEISKYACDYIEKEFRFRIFNAPFAGFSSNEKFDAVCGWYFFEHERNVPETIIKAASFLKAGGVLALSLPSINGPMFRLNTDEWMKTHPKDHSIDLSPRSVRILLRKAGFGKIRIYPAGIHADRVFRRTSVFFPVLKLFYRIYSNFFNYSDTMEVYATKNK